MIKIFLAHSTIDKKDFIDIVAEKLKEKPEYYTLWYYDHPFAKDINPMDEILDRLCETDLFVIFISQHSLNSPNVLKEVKRASELYKNGYIKKIESILIDSSVIHSKDNKLYNYFKKHTFSYVNTPENAFCLIEKYCSDL